MAKTETWQSRKATYSTEGCVGTRVFRCDWDDRLSEKDDLIGTKWPDGASSDFSCVAVDIEPFGDVDTSGGGPNQAMLIAHYTTDKSKKNTSLSDLTVTIEFGGQGLSIGEGLYWSDASDVSGNRRKVDDNSMTMIMPQATITYSGVVSDLRLPTVLSLIGKVNSDTASWSPAASYLFEGGTAYKVFGAVPSDARWQINYKFTYNPYTWNRFWNKYKTSGPGMTKVTDSGGTPIDIYSLASFESLVHTT